MMFADLIRGPRNRLDIVAGLIDGILNALTLASAKLMVPGNLTLPMIGKVAAVTGCTTCFVFFVAHYAQLRAELVRSARELNLLSHGHLATTQLGKRILYEALWGAIVASVCGIAGSAIPLAMSWALPQVPLLALALTVVLLGILGWVLAVSVFGSPILWTGGLMLGGVVVAEIGIKLDILS